MKRSVEAGNLKSKGRDGEFVCVCEGMGGFLVLISKLKKILDLKVLFLASG